MSERPDITAKIIPNNTDQTVTPLWEGGDRSFQSMSCSKFQRKNVTTNQYHIYSDRKNFITVQADTVIKALEHSPIKTPYKIEHAFGRLPHVMEKPSLEFNQTVSIPTAGTAPINETITPNKRI